MVYAISPLLQKQEIETHCRQCDHLALEGIDMGEWGSFCACYYDDCPHEINRTPVIGTVHGDDVCVRRLSDADENICRMDTEFYGGTETGDKR